MPVVDRLHAAADYDHAEGGRLTHGLDGDGCLRIGLSKCAQTQVIPTANNSLIFKVSPWQVSAWLRCLESGSWGKVFLWLSPPSSFSNVDPGKGVKQSKNIQQPQHDGNDHDAIQN